MIACVQVRFHQGNSGDHLLDLFSSLSSPCAFVDLIVVTFPSCTSMFNLCCIWFMYGMGGQCHLKLVHCRIHFWWQLLLPSDSSEQSVRIIKLTKGILVAFLFIFQTHQLIFPHKELCISCLYVIWILTFCLSLSDCSSADCLSVPSFSLSRRFTSCLDSLSLSSSGCSVSSIIVGNYQEMTLFHTIQS